MLQDIYPYKLNNHFEPEAEASEKDTIFIWRGTSLVSQYEKIITFPKVSDLTVDVDIRFTYLFAIDEERFFMCEVSDEQLVELSKCGFELHTLQEFRGARATEKHKVFAAYTGKHLADWYRDTRFCGCCGSRMKHSVKERAMVCPVCGHTAYPRIMPAVIVGVTNGDKLLITKYRNGYAHSALVAGFTEIGETLEETVSREVLEETGVHIKNIRYYKSQPWGMANDILVGFFCDVDGDKTIRMDEEELKEARWVKRDDIELQPDDISLTNEMMKKFIEG